MKVNIKAGTPVLIDERRLSQVDYYIDCCNGYVEKASEAYKEVESALQDRLVGLGFLSGKNLI